MKSLIVCLKHPCRAWALALAASLAFFACSNGAKLAVTSSRSMRSAPRMGTIPTGPRPPSVTVWRRMSRPSQETLSWSPTRSITSSNGFFPLTCISDFMTRPVSRSVRTSGPEIEKSPLIP